MRYYTENISFMTQIIIVVRITCDGVFPPLMFNSMQNRSQKAVNRGALLLCGGLDVCARGAWHANLTKSPLIYNVSYFNLGGLEALFGLTQWSLDVILFWFSLILTQRLRFLFCNFSLFCFAVLLETSAWQPFTKSSCAKRFEIIARKRSLLFILLVNLKWGTGELNRWNLFPI